MRPPPPPPGSRAARSRRGPRSPGAACPASPGRPRSDARPRGRRRVRIRVGDRFARRPAPSGRLRARAASSASRSGRIQAPAPPCARDRPRRPPGRPRRRPRGDRARVGAHQHGAGHEAVPPKGSAVTVPGVRAASTACDRADGGRCEDPPVPPRAPPPCAARAAWRSRERPRRLGPRQPAAARITNAVPARQPITIPSQRSAARRCGDASASASSAARAARPPRAGPAASVSSSSVSGQAGRAATDDAQRLAPFLGAPRAAARAFARGREAGPRRSAPVSTARGPRFSSWTAAVRSARRPPRAGLARVERPPQRGATAYEPLDAPDQRSSNAPA
jgi:hypothetical protein